MESFDSSGAAFGKDTPILRLSQGNVRDARWVLLPVFVWRVVAPVPRERKLNVFQRAVLGLARAGVVRVGEVSERLLIAPDLAGLVALELQQMALLDHAGRPTTRGLEWLEDVEDEPAEDAQVGHVLSDAFTGKLWPRFLTGDLPVADWELDDHGRPVLLSGSAGDPWRDSAFRIRPTGQDGVVKPRPDVKDVLRVASRHRRQRQQEGDDFDEVDSRDVPRLQRVSFVDDEPQPFLFALRVRRHVSGDWMVDDPFGHGEAVELRARLEERLDSQNGLRRWLEPLVGTDADTDAPTLGKLQLEAEWKVEERLTIAIRQHETARARLVAMQRALLEAESSDAPADKWDDVVVKAQRAVERALRSVYERYRKAHPRLFSKLAESDKQFNRHLLDTMAADLGFHRPLPESLSSVRRGKVQSAERNGGGSLRPLLLLNLLGADREDAHPLRRAAPASPDLLHRLDALATARDRAAHDGAETRPQAVQRHVETAYAAVEALLLAH